MNKIATRRIEENKKRQKKQTDELKESQTDKLTNRQTDKLTVYHIYKDINRHRKKIKCQIDEHTNSLSLTLSLFCQSSSSIVESTLTHFVLHKSEKEFNRDYINKSFNSFCFSFY